MRKILFTFALIITLSVNLMALSNMGGKYKAKNSDTTYTKSMHKNNTKVNKNMIKTSTTKSTHKTNTNKSYKEVTKSYKIKSIGKVERIKRVINGRTIIQPFGIVHYVHNFNVKIWTDEREYYSGDRIKVYVRANRNCYIVVYDIDTEGNVNIIYPEYGSGYLRAYRRKRIDRWWYVDGPEGYEELIVVASRSPIDAYNYGIYLRDQLRYNRGKEYFRVIPGGYRRISVASTHFYINDYYYNDYYNDDYYNDYIPYSGFGFIIIEAPIWGWVYIDGRYYGRGSCRIPKMKPGWHTIMMKQNGKVKYKKRIYVNKNKKYKVNLRNR